MYGISLHQCIGRQFGFSLFVCFVFAFVCLRFCFCFLFLLFSYKYYYYHFYPHAFRHFAVSLGFIKEVPATSCREIKASEGASAVSGNYWLDSIKPGQVTLVSCDMRTGGEFLSGICGLRHSYLLLSRRR